MSEQSILENWDAHFNDSDQSWAHLKKGQAKKLYSELVDKFGAEEVNKNCFTKPTTMKPLSEVTTIGLLALTGHTKKMEQSYEERLKYIAKLVEDGDEEMLKAIEQSEEATPARASITEETTIPGKFRFPDALRFLNEKVLIPNGIDLHINEGR